MCNGSAYYDLRPVKGNGDSLEQGGRALKDSTQRQVEAVLSCRRTVRWQGVPIPECEYCGAACVTDEDEAMLAEAAREDDEDGY